jgi:hypothetical protein
MVTATLIASHLDGQSGFRIIRPRDHFVLTSSFTKGFVQIQGGQERHAYKKENDIYKLGSTL